MTLRELRAYTGSTQVETATRTRMSQPELSRLERRDDFLLSTLRHYVAALGGKLDVVVTLGSSAIHLTDGEAKAPPPDAAAIAAAIDGLAELASWLPPLVTGLPPRARRDGCGGFALVEHVWHLRDVDVLGYAVRLRRALAHDRPRLPNLDGDALAKQRGYLSKPLAPALAVLLASRAKSVAKLRALRPAQLRRRLVVDGAGELSIGELVVRWRTHDLGHKVEIERLAAALRAGPA
jgi:hypothetical protein